MRRIKQLRALSRAERNVLFRAAVWLPIAALSLRLVGFKQTQAFFAGRGASFAQAPVTVKDIQRAKNTARMVQVAANHGLVRTRCLQRSLVLTRLLGSQRIPCALILGARQQDEGLKNQAEQLKYALNKQAPSDQQTNEKPKQTDRI